MQFWGGGEHGCYASTCRRALACSPSSRISLRRIVSGKDTISAVRLGFAVLDGMDGVGSAAHY